MAYLRKISERNQITIPPSLLKIAGISEGDLVALEAHDGKITLERRQVVEKDFAAKDWEALDELVRGQIRKKQYTQYSNPQEAETHLKRLLK
ncbi:MAG: AbrB/MazE/SpoVT family DNA-binding domain-containing protein [Elusimicrobia bacterium]|nr:AbrB/MazE/SpoVT family DNA-binding domain-containing protein [Elusimicrobiota bacterium]